MAKLTRFTHKIFGITANFASQMGKFGSLKNGSGEFAADAEEVQTYGNFESGLYDAVIGNNSPAIQDMNGAHHHASRQIGYLFQSGIAEYDSGTTYYIGSRVVSGDYVWTSLTDSNIGNTPAFGSSDWFSQERADVGSIRLMGTDSVPTGTLECDGSAISRTTYADLFAVIGTRYGNGDTTTTFNIPDFRGAFPRGWDHGAGNDPDAAGRTANNSGGVTADNVGSEQGFALEGHDHNLKPSLTGQQPNLNLLPTPGASFGGIANGTSGTPVGTIAVGTVLTGTTSTETRAFNVSAMFCIKY